MKLPIGTKVKMNMNMNDQSDSDLIKLLNTLEGEIVGFADANYFDEPGYQIAYPLDQIDAIQKATNKHFGTKVEVQLTYVHLSRSLNRPKDKRYYLYAYEGEVTPI